MPKKKDALIVALVLLAAVALLAASRLMPRTDLSQKVAQETLAPDAVEYIDATAAPAETQAPADSEAPAETAAPADTEAPAETAAPAATEAPAETEAPKQADVAGPMPAPQTGEVRGYVVITVGNRQYGDPIPMDRDKVITIRQSDGKENKVHITPEKVYMEHSTCENQDCVGQGEITLDNYRTRILSTYVICLPNAVTIEMVPVE